MLQQLFKALNFINRKAKSKQIQLLIFIVSQFICVALAITLLNYTQQREKQLADYQLKYITETVKDKVNMYVNRLETTTNEVVLRLDFESRWYLLDKESGYSTLQDLKQKAGDLLTRIFVFDTKGEEILSTRGIDFKAVNVVDREYFTLIATTGVRYKHFGPYISRATGELAYSVAHRLTNSNGTFGGVVLLSVNMKELQTLCTKTVPLLETDVFVLTGDNKVLLHCTHMGSVSESIGKSLKAVIQHDPVVEEDLKDGKFNESDDHVGYVLNVSDSPYTSLKIAAFSDKSVLHSALHGLVIQNYLLFLMAVVSQILCFMLFNRVLSNCYKYCPRVPKIRNEIT